MKHRVPLLGAILLVAIALLVFDPASARAKREKSDPGTFRVFRNSAGPSGSRLVDTRSGRVWVEAPDNEDEPVVHAWDPIAMPPGMPIGDVDTYTYEYDVFYTGYYDGYYGSEVYADDMLLNTATGQSWRFDSETSTFVPVERR